jgi:hypothetical protein
VPNSDPDRQFAEMQLCSIRKIGKLSRDLEKAESNATSEDDCFLFAENSTLRIDDHSWERWPIFSAWLRDSFARLLLTSFLDLAALSAGTPKNSGRACKSMRTRVFRYSVRLIRRDAIRVSISSSRSSGIENEQGLLLGLCIVIENNFRQKLL